MPTSAGDLSFLKLMKCVGDTPHRACDARKSKRFSEYQEAYQAWPLIPLSSSFKPEPPKKSSEKPQPMQKKTTYSVDFDYPVLPRPVKVKKWKYKQKAEVKPSEKISVYNMDFYTKQLPKNGQSTKEPVQPKQIVKTEPIKFEGETVYTMSYPFYDTEAIHSCRPPVIVAKDNLDVPAGGDIEKNPKTTTQDAFIHHEGAIPPKPVKPARASISVDGHPMATDTEYKQRYIDPVEHRHIVRLTVKEKEKTPEFTDITTAMADYTKPAFPGRRRPKITPQAIKIRTAPFDGQTTFRLAYKEWPLMPPQVPEWAKKPVYKRPTGRFVTRSLYAADYCDPRVEGREPEITPRKREQNIITNSTPKTTEFTSSSTYRDDYQHWEGQAYKPPAGYHVLEKYKPPEEPMWTETVHMADYTGETTEKLKPIRHISEHRLLHAADKMSFVTTYNENFCSIRPMSCPSKIQTAYQPKPTTPTIPASIPSQIPNPAPAYTPIPKPNFSVLPRINTCPTTSLPATPESISPAAQGSILPPAPGSIPPATPRSVTPATPVSLPPATPNQGQP